MQISDNAYYSVGWCLDWAWHSDCECVGMLHNRCLRGLAYSVAMGLGAEKLIYIAFDDGFLRWLFHLLGIYFGLREIF